MMMDNHDRGPAQVTAVILVFHTDICDRSLSRMNSLITLLATALYSSRAYRSPIFLPMPDRIMQSNFQTPGGGGTEL